MPRVSLWGGAGVGVTAAGWLTGAGVAGVGVAAGFTASSRFHMSKVLRLAGLQSPVVPPVKTVCLCILARNFLGRDCLALQQGWPGALV